MILSKQQTMGAIMLVSMVASVLVFIHFVPQRPLPSLPSEDTLLQSDTFSHKYVHRTFVRDTIRLCLQTFDPNTADSLTLLSLGLKPWQVRNILRYRQKGGRYRSPEAFRTLYGLTDSAYHVLLPYITIDTTLFPAKDTLSRPTTRLYHLKRDTILELNAADTSALQFIRGIGPYTALRIVRYREQLGGYYSTEQLREIEGLDCSWDSIIPHLTICRDSLHPLAVNRASLRQLTRHPYIRFEQADALYRLRRRKMHLDSEEVLYQLPEFDTTTIHRLHYYLSFE